MERQRREGGGGGFRRDQRDTRGGGRDLHVLTDPNLVNSKAALVSLEGAHPVDLNVNPLVPSDVDAIQSFRHRSVLQGSVGTLLWFLLHMKFTNALRPCAFHVPQVHLQLEMTREIAIQLSSQQRREIKSEKARREERGREGEPFQSNASGCF
jgi:hypothetical protein